MKKLLCLGLSLGLVTLAGCTSDELKNLEKELNETKQLLQEKESELEKAQSNLNEQKTLNEALKNQANDLNNQVNDLNNQVTDLNQRLDNYINGKYEITYTDAFDNSITKTIPYSRYSSVLEALQNEFELESYPSTYGTYIASINNSFNDSNWAIMIYENGASALTGIDELEINVGDKFEFKHECWNTVESGYGTMDSYDILVDKAIYYYASNYMNELIKEDTAYSGSNYWTYMMINLMKQNNYDQKYFNTSSATAEFIESVKGVDVKTLTGANIGKYYYVANALGLDLTAYKNNYLNYNFGTTYSEYQSPFTLSPSKSLNLTNDTIANLVNTQNDANLQWGIDGYCWQQASNALLKPDTTKLDTLTLKDYANGASNACLLMAYAAYNKDVRTNEFDFIKMLFDTYYDQELNLVKYKPTDTKTQMSTNQIYAGLCAYKVSRDLNTNAYIFA